MRLLEKAGLRTLAIISMPFFAALCLGCSNEAVGIWAVTYIGNGDGTGTPIGNDSALGTLTFSSDGTFALNISTGLGYVGEYSVEDHQVSIVFGNGDRASALISGDTMFLTYPEQPYEWTLRKIR